MVFPCLLLSILTPSPLDGDSWWRLKSRRTLLMLTQAEGAFPTGPTIWKARDAWGTAGLRYGYLAVAQGSRVLAEGKEGSATR